MGNGFSWNSPQGNWERENAWGEAGQPYDWRTAGFDPQNPWGTTYYQPGSDPFRITPWDEHAQNLERVRMNQGIVNATDAGIARHGWVAPGRYESINVGGQEFLGMDPTGALNFNFGAMGLGGAGGGYQGPAGGGAYGAWQGGPVTAPGGWSEDPYQARTVDPAAAIAAAQPRIQENMENAFADAGNRLGQSGFAMSTPYTGEAGLGGAARRAASDLAEIESRYTYDASKFNSAQEAAMHDAMMNRKFGGWGQKGGWDMAAQLADQGNQFAAWQQGGNWNQANLDRDLARWQIEQSLGQNQMGMMTDIMRQFV